MTRAVVLGIGSPFGADRLGWEAVRLLRAEARLLSLPAGSLALQSCDRPGSQLLALMRGAELAVLIDAVQGAVGDGRVLRFEAGEPGARCAGVSSHGFGVAQTLALGAALGELPPRLVLFGLDVGDEPARLPDAGALVRLATAVADELCAFLGEPKPARAAVVRRD